MSKSEDIKGSLVDAVEKKGVVWLPASQLSNAQYHGEKSFFSSSQLKDVLENEEMFFTKHIAVDKTLAEVGDGLQSAFDTGTAFHTMILEPELADSIICYSAARRGEKWEAFKSQNEGKLILSENEYAKANGMAESVKRSQECSKLLKHGVSEESCFVKFWAGDAGVFCNPQAKVWLKLTLTGWKTLPRAFSTDKLTPIFVKARADRLRRGNWCLDLKSMSGNPKDEKLIASKIVDMNYDLSAAFYLSIFSCEKPEEFNEMQFIWVFASKDLFQSQIWVATEEMLMLGRLKVVKALKAIASGCQRNWKFEEKVLGIDPPYWAMDELKKQIQKDEDCDL